MNGHVTSLLSTKAIIAFLAFVILFGGIYTIQQQQATPAEQPKDAYVDTIQKNAEYINNVVIEIVRTEGTEANLTYWGNCDDVLYKIRMQNTEAEQGYPTVSANHKDINLRYRAFLHEAANAVLTCENGGKPDLTKMNAAKAALY